LRLSAATTHNEDALRLPRTSIDSCVN